MLGIILGPNRFQVDHLSGMEGSSSVLCNSVDGKGLSRLMSWNCHGAHFTFEAGMKQFAGAVLMVHMLLSTWAPGGLAEIARVPSLQDHYAEHLAESGGAMGWGEFLLLHFTDIEHARRDSNRHGDLPFHGSSMAMHLFLPTANPVVTFPLAIHRIVSAAGQVLEVGEWPGRTVFHPPKSIG